MTRLLAVIGLVGCLAMTQGCALLLLPAVAGVGVGAGMETHTVLHAKDAPPAEVKP